MKLIFFLITILITLFLKTKIALAHCPLCVAGAGAGLTLSRLLGVDDSITGIWLGGFIGATAFWTQKIAGKKIALFLERFPGLLIYVLFFTTTIWSFYKFNLIVRHGDIFGFDKLPFGTVLGGSVFYLSDYLNLFIKKKSGVLFAYQSIVVNLSLLAVASLVIYILINYYI